MLDEKVKILASYLHKQFCCYNHADYCFWYYEFDNKVEQWSGSSHCLWIEKAEKIIEKIKELEQTNV